MQQSKRLELSQELGDAHLGHCSSPQWHLDIIAAKTESGTSFGEEPNQWKPSYIVGLQMNFCQHHQRGTLTAAKENGSLLTVCHRRSSCCKSAYARPAHLCNTPCRRAHAVKHREGKQGIHTGHPCTEVTTETLVSSRSEITLDPLLATIAIQVIMFLRRFCCPCNPGLKEILSK